MSLRLLKLGILYCLILNKTEYYFNYISFMFFFGILQNFYVVYTVKYYKIKKKTELCFL